MTSSGNNREFLEELFQDQNKRLESLSDKLEEYHIEHMRELHDIKIQVASHEKTFSMFKWIAGSGGALSLFSFMKDWQSWFKQ